PARSADRRERAAALAAELPAGLVLRSACGAPHASSVEPSVQRCQHHRRPGPLAHLRESVVLVEVDRRIVGLDAEADPREAVLARGVEQRAEQLLAEPPAALAGDDRDRQLRRLLVDEAVARLVLLEEPVPGGADGLELVDRDQGVVAAAAPAGDVALEGDVGLGAPPRVVRVTEHVPQERQILRPRGPDQPISSVSWIRFPSGSNTSTIRTWPCSSRTTPTSTPCSRRRSASARTSGTVIDATPPSSPWASQSEISMSSRRSRAQRPSSSEYRSWNPSTSR